MAFRTDYFGLLALALSLQTVGCTPAEPPRWAEGGAPLALGNARWDRADGGPVELFTDGRVLVDGELDFVIDRVGRVSTDEYEAFAVLQPDGQLVDAQEASLGRIGVTNASPPGQAEAWLSLSPNGRVTYFDPDGERSAGGVWHGCEGPVLRACTLVTHLIAIQNSRAAARGVGIGIGVGVGVGVGF